ncbi:WCX domain-containing protein [Geochorda subterranea]|uniref:WYL domain-containing protein n=1 Tax=Geochorda subterranea TaxID=3109564 RepID=UPI0038602E3A
MTLEVGHTLQLEPWIRSWGPWVEVLEPEELRRTIARQMEAAAGLYERPGTPPPLVALAAGEPGRPVATRATLSSPQASA